MTSWYIYQGTGEPHDLISTKLPPPPSWRDFVRREQAEDQTLKRRFADLARGTTYQADDDQVRMVNAALYLRRPLLVTGRPGTGKSSLAFAVAHELQLGPVLYWPINSRSTLREGLYHYDAIGRLQDASLLQATELSQSGSGSDRQQRAEVERIVPDIGKYVHLGPLGTALLPTDRPRVLLTDEIDKSDIDLPNDLLNTFEEGAFEIPELVRMASARSEAQVSTADEDGLATITHGRVQCTTFPVVVMTSNGERDFPPPFLRRCLHLHIRPPDREKLAKIVEAHLGPEARDKASFLITEFLNRRQKGDLAADQLLNAVYLLTRDGRPSDINQRERLEPLLDDLLRPLSSTALG